MTTRTEHIGFKVTPKTDREIRDVAKIHGISITELMNRVWREWLMREGVATGRVMG